MSICHRTEKGTRFPRVGVIGGCKPRKQIQFFLQVYQVLLATEPSLHRSHTQFLLKRQPLFPKSLLLVTAPLELDFLLSSGQYTYIKEHRRFRERRGDVKLTVLSLICQFLDNYQVTGHSNFTLKTKIIT